MPVGGRAPRKQLRFLPHKMKEKQKPAVKKKPYKKKQTAKTQAAKKKGAGAAANNKVCEWDTRLRPQINTSDFFVFFYHTPTRPHAHTQTRRLHDDYTTTHKHDDTQALPPDHTTTRKQCHTPQQSPTAPNSNIWFFCFFLPHAHTPTLTRKHDDYTTTHKHDG